MISSSSSSPASREETSATAEVDVRESKITNSRSSVAFLSKSVTEPEIKDRSPDVGNDGSDQSFTPNHSTPFRKSHLTNQSMHYDDEMSDNSLHNPSIMVMVGDSFSHYKSMDLGNENVSLSEGRDSQEQETDLRNLITTDNISKENFVAEWLQNKTGKGNHEIRILEKLSASRDHQGILAASVNENPKEGRTTNSNKEEESVSTGVSGESQESGKQHTVLEVKGKCDILSPVENLKEKTSVNSVTSLLEDQGAALKTVSEQPRHALDGIKCDQNPAENDVQDVCVATDAKESAANADAGIGNSEIRSSDIAEVQIESSEKLTVSPVAESESPLSGPIENEEELYTDDLRAEELQNLSIVEDEIEPQETQEGAKIADVEIEPQETQEAKIVDDEIEPQETQEAKIADDEIEPQETQKEAKIVDDEIEPQETQEAKTVHDKIEPQETQKEAKIDDVETEPQETQEEAKICSTETTKKADFAEKIENTVSSERLLSHAIQPPPTQEIKTKLEFSVVANNSETEDVEKSPVECSEEHSITPQCNPPEAQNDSPTIVTEDFKSVDMEIDDAVLPEIAAIQTAEVSIEEKFKEVRSAIKNKFSGDSPAKNSGSVTEKRQKMSPEYEEQVPDNYTINERPLLSQIPKNAIIEPCQTAEMKNRKRDSTQRFILEKIQSSFE